MRNVGAQENISKRALNLRECLSAQDPAEDFTRFLLGFYQVFTRFPLGFLQGYIGIALGRTPPPRSSKDQTLADLRGRGRGPLTANGGSYIYILYIYIYVL